MKRIRVSLEDLREVAIAAGVKDDYITDDSVYVEICYQENINEYSYSLTRPDYDADCEHAVVYLFSFTACNGKITGIDVGKCGNVIDALHKMVELGLIEK